MHEHLSNLCTKWTIRPCYCVIVRTKFEFCHLGSKQYVATEDLAFMIQNMMMDDWFPRIWLTIKSLHNTPGTSAAAFDHTLIMVYCIELSLIWLTSHNLEWRCSQHIAPWDELDIKVSHLVRNIQCITFYATFPYTVMACGCIKKLSKVLLSCVLPMNRKDIQFPGRRTCNWIFCQWSIVPKWNLRLWDLLKLIQASNLMDVFYSFF